VKIGERKEKRGRGKALLVASGRSFALAAMKRGEKKKGGKGISPPLAIIRARQREKKKGKRGEKRETIHLSCPARARNSADGHDKRRKGGRRRKRRKEEFLSYLFLYLHLRLESPRRERREGKGKEKRKGPSF